MPHPSSSPDPEVRALNDRVVTTQTRLRALDRVARPLPAYWRVMPLMTLFAAGMVALNLALTPEGEGWISDTPKYAFGTLLSLFFLAVCAGHFAWTVARLSVNKTQRSLASRQLVTFTHQLADATAQRGALTSARVDEADRGDLSVAREDRGGTKKRRPRSRAPRST